MKKKIAALALAALLLGSGCAPAPREEEGWLLYFCSADGDSHGPALTGEVMDWPAEEEPDAEEMLRALLSGPTREDLVSPFPRGVTLQRLELDDQGVMRVRLSEAYSGLTEISLTLADYAIVLTLTQLEGVEAVEIQTTGYSANYRSHQVLRPEEALMEPLLQPEETSS